MNTNQTRSYSRNTNGNDLARATIGDKSIGDMLQNGLDIIRGDEGMNRLRQDSQELRDVYKKRETTFRKWEMSSRKDWQVSVRC